MQIEEIRELDIETLTARAEEIKAELDAEGADVEALSAEIDALESRKKELREQAQKRAEEVRNAIENGTVTKTFKEKTTMEERTFAVSSVEYRDAYMKSLMGLGMEAEERAALTSAASVIPTTTLDKIYGKLMENPLIAEIDTLRIPGYVSIPKATTVNDAAWVAMATAATDSADVVGSVALSAKKLIKTIEITADIKAMSIAAFEGWLVNKLVQKMEAAICAAVINGAGSATVPAGVLKEGNSTKSSVTTVSLANLGKLCGELAAPYHKDAIFVMTSAMFFTKILPLAGDSNGVLVANGLEYRLLGHKVVLDENAGSNIIFGAFKNYVFNFGEGISVEADQSVAFRSGSTVYRAMALCDGNVADPEAFVYAAIA